MSKHTEFDSVILGHVKASRITARELIKLRDASWPETGSVSRQVDAALQRLRRAGLITWDKRWRRWRVADA